MNATLKKFKEHLDAMEGDFEFTVQSTTQMNGMLKSYEKSLLGQLTSGYE